MRLGLFGGSFDPVHHGHLRLAACCAERAGLDQVWFVPAAVQPFKQPGPVAGDADRLAMLRLATEGRPDFVVSTIEIDRGGVSYSVDTLRDLANWREPDEVLRLATPLVVQRPGESELADAPPHARVDMPPTDISSSDIRERVAGGDSIEGLVPQEVADYVAAHGLYCESE